VELHHPAQRAPRGTEEEKEKQLREAAIARGEAVPDATVADFKAQADRLYPDGIAAPAVAVPPPPPAAVAPLPPAAVGPLPPAAGAPRGGDQAGAFDMAAAMGDEE
jgi:hypothetical protein